MARKEYCTMNAYSQFFSSLASSLIPLVEKEVQANLSDDLRKKEYQGHPNPLYGHCYVASETLYHILGAEKSDYCATRVKHEGTTHWYLTHKKTGDIIDPTRDQFETPVPYDEGVRAGFLTKEPSKRAKTLMARMRGQE
ncbi:MAG: hypothetical protein NWE76_01940 [Candidatus Bathyarchaeota archaeon]|nr:hypothetical protein [Candidatus Bathyarchaeota archaeon]